MLCGSGTAADDDGTTLPMAVCSYPGPGIIQRASHAQERTLRTQIREMHDEAITVPQPDHANPSLAANGSRRSFWVLRPPVQCRSDWDRPSHNIGIIHRSALRRVAKSPRPIHVPPTGAIHGFPLLNSFVNFEKWSCTAKQIHCQRRRPAIVHCKGPKPKWQSKQATLALMADHSNSHKIPRQILMPLTQFISLGLSNLSPDDLLHLQHHFIYC